MTATQLVSLAITTASLAVCIVLVVVTVKDLLARRKLEIDLVIPTRALVALACGDSLTITRQDGRHVIKMMPERMLNEDEVARIELACVPIPEPEEPPVNGDWEW